MKVSLLVPTLNEIEGMRLVMPRVQPEWVHEIVVVDGGSTDGTVDFAREHGYRVVEQTTPGITGAYQDALPQLTGDIVIAFSPDNNSVPELIPVLVRKMSEGYDMVIASRYLPGAHSEDDDFITALGNRIFTTLINRCFGGKYTDALVMFRAWRVDLVTKLPTQLPRAGIEPLLAIRCAKRRLRVAEIPGDEPKRVGSERKMRPFLNGMHVLRLILSELLDG